MISRQSGRVRARTKQIMTIIYKICTQNAWAAAVEKTWFAGSADDLRDGFIHFSTAAQLTETVRRHFFNQRDLMIVAVSVAALGDGLKWEPSRGGELFPHLYGPLPVDSVICAAPLTVNADGTIQLPDEAR